MTKPLKSFPEKERYQIAKKRASSKEIGLGQLSAQDFINKSGKVKTEKSKAEEVEN